MIARHRLQLGCAAEAIEARRKGRGLFGVSSFSAMLPLSCPLVPAHIAPLSPSQFSCRGPVGASSSRRRPYLHHGEVNRSRWQILRHDDSKGLGARRCQYLTHRTQVSGDRGRQGTHEDSGPKTGDAESLYLCNDDWYVPWRRICPQHGGLMRHSITGFGSTLM